MLALKEKACKKYFEVEGKEYGSTSSPAEVYQPVTIREKAKEPLSGKQESQVELKFSVVEYSKDLFLPILTDKTMKVISEGACLRSPKVIDTETYATSSSGGTRIVIQEDDEEDGGQQQSSNPLEKTSIPVNDGFTRIAIQDEDDEEGEEDGGDDAKEEVIANNERKMENTSVEKDVDVPFTRISIQDEESEDDDDEEDDQNKYENVVEQKTIKIDEVDKVATTDSDSVPNKNVTFTRINIDDYDDDEDDVDEVEEKDSIVNRSDGHINSDDKKAVEASGAGAAVIPPPSTREDADLVAEKLKKLGNDLMQAGRPLDAVNAYDKCIALGLTSHYWAAKSNRALTLIKLEVCII